MTSGDDRSLLRRAWVYLAAAIVLELLGIAWLKQSEVFTRPVPAVSGCLAYFAAFALLGRVMRVMPASMTYTVWNGIGAAGVTVTGCAFFGDRLSATTATGVVLTVCGAVLINVGHGKRTPEAGCHAVELASAEQVRDQ